MFWRMFVVSIRFLGAIISDKDEDIANAAHEIVLYCTRDVGMSWVQASDHVSTRLERVIAYIHKARTP